MTIQTLLEWSGMIGTVFGVVAFIKIQYPSALSTRALRWWAFWVGFGLQLFVAANQHLFVLPIYSLTNVTVVVLAVLTAVYIVHGTAGVQKDNKGNPEEPTTPAVPGAPTAVTETKKALDAVQPTTTAPIGGSPS